MPTAAEQHRRARACVRGYLEGAPPAGGDGDRHRVDALLELPVVGPVLRALARICVDVERLRGRRAGCAAVSGTAEEGAPLCACVCGDPSCGRHAP